MNELIYVVVGVLINDRDEVLITQRQAHQDLAGCWEFPGGKRESDEAPVAALIREFKEELGIDVLSASPWFQQTHDFTHKSVLLDIWFIDQYKGTPAPQEGQPMRWVPIAELKEYTFPAPNIVIVDKLIVTV
jgi:8-oxo-dGTP diphosphatase